MKKLLSLFIIVLLLPIFPVIISPSPQIYTKQHFGTLFIISSQYVTAYDSDGNYITLNFEADKKSYKTVGEIIKQGENIFIIDYGTFKVEIKFPINSPLAKINVYGNDMDFKKFKFKITTNLQPEYLKGSEKKIPQNYDTEIDSIKVGKIKFSWSDEKKYQRKFDKNGNSVEFDVNGAFVIDPTIGSDEGSFTTEKILYANPFTMSGETAYMISDHYNYRIDGVLNNEFNYTLTVGYGYGAYTRASTVNCLEAYTEARIQDEYTSQCSSYVEKQLFNATVNLRFYYFLESYCPSGYSSAGYSKIEVYNSSGSVIWSEYVSADGDTRYKTKSGNANLNGDISKIVLYTGSIGRVSNSDSKHRAIIDNIIVTNSSDYETIYYYVNESGAFYNMTSHNPFSYSYLLIPKGVNIDLVNTTYYLYSGNIFMKSHIINPTSGAGTGYQVRIKAYYGSGTDSGENVYLNGKCRSDFADVRFLAADKVTQLSYWIEEKVDGNYAIFWVKVNDDLSSSPATIYIFYGDPSLTTTASNGAATFNLFDDFDRADSQTIGNGWTEDEASGCSLSIESNMLKIYAYENYYCHIEKAFPSLTNFAIVAKMKSVSYSGVSWRPSIVAYWSPYNYAQAGITLATSSQYVTYDIDGTVTNAEQFQASANTWYYAMITADSSEVKFWRSMDANSWTLSYTLTRPSQWVNAPSMIIVGKGYAQSSSQFPNSDLDNNYSPSGYMGTNYIDYVYVRKYVSPEPSHGEWGSEFPTVSFSVTYGQISTESELTVRIPRMTFQEISVNASSTWPAPESANDVMKLIAESEWGRYALVVLPIFVMLVAGSRHTAGVAGGVATGLC
ncbi:MAG: DUF2341 domain-containing protein, partial [Candidatus Methanomethylicaceae archaeon]